MSNPNGRNSVQKRAIKSQLINRDGSKCNICGKVLTLNQLTIDHIIPLTSGGSWKLSNLQLSCMNCNQTKADNSIFKILETL